MNCRSLNVRGVVTSIDVKTYEDEYASLMEEVSGSTSDNSDYGFNNSEQDNDTDNNMKIYHCQSCGRTCCR